MALLNEPDHFGVLTFFIVETRKVESQSHAIGAPDFSN
jgi:hypothetical protein